LALIRLGTSIFDNIFTHPGAFIATSDDRKWKFTMIEARVLWVTASEGSATAVRSIKFGAKKFSPPLLTVLVCSLSASAEVQIYRLAVLFETRTLTEKVIRVRSDDNKTSKAVSIT
jgi:hypothetical protein